MDTLDVKLMDTKIQLFLNSLDIIAESIFENFVELATFMTINASFGSQKFNKGPGGRPKRAQSIRFSKENSLLNWDCVSDFPNSLLNGK